MFKRLIVISMVIFLLAILVSCNNDQANDNGELVVYTSVDQNVSELIFDDFEKETGIIVKPVYDIEASKTTGLVNRLIAEKKNPQADVFWSSEIIMTLRLEEEGILQPYISENSLTIPDSYKDNEGYWTGFGGRARVMIINTDIMDSGVYPDSVHDLTDKKYSSYKKAIAYPMFGTAMTHMFVMNQKWGEEETIDYFSSAIENNTLVVDGNSVVRDLVASGEVAFGITDTDDAYGALKNGSPVEVIYLDQDGQGTLLIPNTTGLINDCINTNEGQLFIDYLLNPKTVDKLVEIGFIDISLQNENNVINFIECDFQKAYANGSDVLNKLKGSIIR